MTDLGLILYGIMIGIGISGAIINVWRRLEDD